MSLSLALLVENDEPFLLNQSGGGTRRVVRATANHLCKEFSTAGLAPGSRIGILLADPTDAVIALLSVLTTDFVAVPIHHNAPVAEIGRIVQDCGASAIISTPAEFKKLQHSGEGPSLVEMPKTSLNIVVDPPELTGNAHGLALIMYTSGTTGTAKGVTITRANLDSMTELLIQDFFRVDQNDTLLLTAPLTNIFGIAICLVALQAGAKLSILSELRPNVIVQTMMRDNVTFLAGVPMIGELLLRATAHMESPFPALRRVLFAGTALSSELAAAFQDRFGVEVMTGYAMTEAVPIALAIDWKSVPENSVGLIARNTEVKIADSSLNFLPQGEIGEILVRGSQVTKSYWNAPEATAKSNYKEWYRTGDVGYLDAEQHLFIVDRLKNIVKTAGHTVYPAEVEATLRAHPGIAEAAVIGIPSQSAGEILVAFVTLLEGHHVSKADIFNWCKTQLSSYKSPRTVRVVKSLPKTASGKIINHLLKNNL